MGTIYTELTDHKDELDEEFLLQSSMVFSSVATKFFSISSANLEAVAIECTLPNHAKWLLVRCY